MSVHSKVATLRAKAAQAGTSTIEGTTVDGGAIANTDVYSEALFVLTVTDLDTDATDKLDVYIDISLDNGISWINAVHFGQFDGTGADEKQLAALKIPDPGLIPTDVKVDAGAGAIRSIGLGTMIRYRGVVAQGAGPATFTYSVQAFFK